MYSQNQEEKFILEALPDKGRLLDLGAFDGITFSNSRALIEKGWSGVLVEASPANADRCRINSKEYAAITCCVAISLEEEGLVRFYESGEMVGTTDIPHMEKWSKEVKFDEIIIYQMTLASMVRDFGNQFDFINIDVEGISGKLGLQAFDLFPDAKCFCIEHDYLEKELRAKAASLGFKEIHYNGENLIFAK